MKTTRASLETLEVFCKTVELGSFTAAARALGLTPQAASRAVTRLEGTLGAALLRRSTRLVRPTEAGRSFHERCRAGLSMIAEASAALASGDRAVGLVRISMPTTFGHHRLLPALAPLRRAHPGLRIEAHVSNHNVDFVREGFDLAVRLGEIDRATFVARNLGDFPLGLFASPAYLARAGTPRSVDDLAQHEAILFTLPSSGRVLPWELAGGRSLRPPAAWLCSEDFLACITLARAGAGIVQAYRFLVERELARRELVEVLPQLGGQTRRFSLVYPKGVPVTPAMRVVIDRVLLHARADRG
ncbi:MAG: LysR family transcriptional regulator [Nannocystaceae bacterium]|nr:LysR family transcriptional regulator [Nannocystaceae bacterium]